MASGVVPLVLTYTDGKFYGIYTFLYLLLYLPIVIIGLAYFLLCFGIFTKNEKTDKSLCLGIIPFLLLILATFGNEFYEINVGNNLFPENENMVAWGIISIVGVMLAGIFVSSLFYLTAGITNKDIKFRLK